MWAGNQTANSTISGQPALPPETQPPILELKLPPDAWLNGEMRLRLEYKLLN